MSGPESDNLVSMSEMRCANHPDTVTGLLCSRCEKPICARCVVQTPVGGRCRECAQVKRSPFRVVSPTLWARAILYGTGAALASGLLIAELGARFRLFGFLLLGIGYLVGEAVSRGARGRVSRELVFLAGGLTVFGALAGQMLALMLRLPPQMPLFTRLELSMQLALGALTGNLFVLLFLVLAVVVATSRVR
jgi:hypothetical protein